MKNAVIAAAALLLLAGCDRYEIDEPGFEVSTAKTTYTTGEEVTFNFTGRPHNITFYSGEIGGRYDGGSKAYEKGTAVLNFTTHKVAGAENTAASDLKVLISTNFGGTLNTANLQAATWTDITSRAAIATGAANVLSGEVDLSEFAQTGRTATVAFKFTDAAKTTGVQQNWRVSNFRIENRLADGRRIFLLKMWNQAQSNEATGDGSNATSMIDWQIYNVANNDAKWIKNTSVWRLDFTPTAAQCKAATESWALTPSIDLTTAAADAGKAIKGITTNLAKYNHTFSKPGTYNVVFVAQNVNIKHEKSVVRRLTVEVVAP